MNAGAEGEAEVPAPIGAEQVPEELMPPGVPAHVSESAPPDKKSTDVEVSEQSTFEEKAGEPDEPAGAKSGYL